MAFGCSRVYLGQAFISSVVFSYGFAFLLVSTFMIFDEVINEHFARLNKTSLTVYSLVMVLVSIALYISISTYQFHPTAQQTSKVDLMCGEGFTLSLVQRQTTAFSSVLLFPIALLSSLLSQRSVN